MDRVLFHKSDTDSGKEMKANDHCGATASVAWWVKTFHEIDFLVGKVVH